MGLFINFSNHQSEKWSSEQLDAARRYGPIVDIPFPEVSPTASPEEITQMAREIMEQIEQVAEERGVPKQDIVVMNQGEVSLVEAMNQEMLERGIRGVVACTERNVTINEDGSRTSSFNFAGFRNYDYSDDAMRGIRARPLSVESSFIITSNFEPSAEMLAATRGSLYVFPPEVSVIKPPVIPPKATTFEVNEVARDFIRDIEETIGRPLRSNDTVSLSGEASFINAANRMLSGMGVRTVTPCSERVSVENADGTKTSRFDFVQFRDIPRYEPNVRAKEEKEKINEKVWEKDYNNDDYKNKDYDYNNEENLKNKVNYIKELPDMDEPIPTHYPRTTDDPIIPDRPDTHDPDIHDPDVPYIGDFPEEPER